MRASAALSLAALARLAALPRSATARSALARSALVWSALALCALALPAPAAFAEPWTGPTRLTGVRPVPIAMLPASRLGRPLARRVDDLLARLSDVDTPQDPSAPPEASLPLIRYVHPRADVWDELGPVLVRHGVLADAAEVTRVAAQICPPDRREDAVDLARCTVDALAFGHDALLGVVGLGHWAEGPPSHLDRLSERTRRERDAWALARARRFDRDLATALEDATGSWMAMAERWVDNLGVGTWSRYRHTVAALAAWRALQAAPPAARPADFPVLPARGYRSPKARSRWYRKLTTEHRAWLRARLCAEGFCAPPPVADEGHPPAAGRATRTRTRPLDPQLRAVVLDWQRARGIHPSGLVDPPSSEALAVPAAARVEALRLALVRMRDVAPGSEPDLLLANIPSFKLEIWRGGALHDTFLTQVGEGWKRTRRGRVPAHRTPLLRSRLRQVVVRPEWVVPSSIRREYRGRIARDPTFLERKGFELRKQGRGDVLVMKPGPGNLLGQVKFLFPNDHLVYLHDTPTQWAFSKPNRTMSHGCVRVARALELAWDLVGFDRGLGRPMREREWQRKYGDVQNKWIALQTSIELHVTYWTAEGLGDGRSAFYPDAYRHDAADQAKVDAAMLARLPRPPGRALGETADAS